MYRERYQQQESVATSSVPWIVATHKALLQSPFLQVPDKVSVVAPGVLLVVEAAAATAASARRRVHATHANIGWWGVVRRAWL